MQPADRLPDKALARRSFEHAAAGYDQAAVLHKLRLLNDNVLCAECLAAFGIRAWIMCKQWLKTAGLSA